MRVCTTEELRVELHRFFPAGAVTWAQATDELRVLARFAAEQLNIPREERINFVDLATTPSNWNTQGVNAVVSYYEQMNELQRQSFLNQAALHFHGMFKHLCD